MKQSKPLKSKEFLILIYTGNGKGKTSAAIGTALRTLAHGGQVAMVQFIKSDKTQRTAVSKMPGIFEKFTLFTMGRGFTWKSEDIHLDQEAARQAWEKSIECLESASYDLVILDEILYAIDAGLIAEESVLSYLKNMNRQCHLVLTGRSASPAMIEAADLVSEIVNRKHPFEDRGLGAQKGLDW